MLMFLFIFLRCDVNEVKWSEVKWRCVNVSSEKKKKKKMVGYLFLF